MTPVVGCSNNDKVAVACLFFYRFNYVCGRKDVHGNIDVEELELELGVLCELFTIFLQKGIVVVAPVVASDAQNL